jgi:micrococcal nuclease
MRRTRSTVLRGLVVALVVALVALGACRGGDGGGGSDDGGGDSGNGEGLRAGPFAVVDVVDGDTLKVNMPDRTTIRVLGMDTPETVDPRKPVECFGREASQRAHELLDGQSVTLEFDARQGREDRFGRTLAYVWLPDGRSFEEAMIAEGYAFEYTYDLPYRYQDAYDAAEAEAREAQRGLWAPGVCTEAP